MKLSRVVVTGASGFVGGHLTRRLLDLGVQVTLFARPSSDLRRLRYLVGNDIANTAVRMVRLDEPGDVLAAVRLAGPDAIIHLAADARARLTGPEADSMRLFQVDAIHALAPAALEVGARFVALSTSDVYGQLPSPHDPHAPLQPLTPYARAKAEVDALLLGEYRDRGLRSVVLRPYSVYGPHQPERQLIAAVIAACHAGRDFPMTSGMQHRDFVYVDDVVHAIYLAASAVQVEGVAIDICSGQPKSVRSVIELIVERIRPSVGGPILGAVPLPPNEALDHFGDARAAFSLLAWQPRIQIEDGLDRQIASFDAMRDGK